LQDGTFERVGGTTTRKVSVRVIAATNKNLMQMVTEKKFREDLYYRLNVFTVRLPALRERVEDIPLLVEHFIALEDAGLTCSASAMDTLKQYSWKGNIRELQSIIKRAVLLSKAESRTMLRLKDFPDEIVKEQNASVNIEEQILRLLREKRFSRSSISETADDIGGLNRGTVAEYFRGFCFKAFVESEYNMTAATKLVAQSADEVICKKVERKLIEYIGNAIEHAKSSQSGEQVILASKPKYKNLPQRYHNYLDEIIASAHRSVWSLKQ
jgi:transcriptional regulator with GAF, ATPase, and Fis domain